MPRNKYKEEEEKNEGFILDGLYKMLSYCRCCKRYQDGSNETCEKYPDGIPPKIWNRRGRVTCPYEDPKNPDKA